MKFALKFFLFCGIVCVVASHTTNRPIRCPRGQVYQECGSACANFCPGDGVFCPTVCKAGCFCPPGQIEVMGICRDKAEFCAREKCPKGQIYNECGNLCDNFCPDAGVLCPTVCTAGCYCPAGKMKVDGECVKKEEHCQKIDCGANASWRNGTELSDSCFETSANDLQFEGCFCDEGFSRLNDECVPWQQCLTDTKCPDGMTFQLCGNECFNDCPDPNRFCNKMCQPGCYCPSDMVKVDGECVAAEEHCEATTTEQIREA